AARAVGSIAGQDESSKPLSPAWGSMSWVVLNSGMASGIAGTSTIFASVVFHCAPNAADPSLVIKSTTNVGGRDGPTAGQSACAAAIAREKAAAAAASASRSEPFLSISVSSSTVSKQDLNLTLDRGAGKAECAARVVIAGRPRLRSAASTIVRRLAKRD